MPDPEIALRRVVYKITGRGQPNDTPDDARQHLDLAWTWRSAQVTWRLPLQSTPTSVPQARHWLLQHYQDHCRNHAVADGQLEDLLALLGTELVANAVLHGAPDVVLSLDVAPTTLRVGCSDGNPQPPVVRHVPLEATGGRGLALIDALAQAWGVTPLDVPAEAGNDSGSRSGRKEVWFELDIFAANHPV